MGVRGLSLALEQSQAARLLAADRPDVFGEFEEQWQEPWVFEHVAM
jgi:hypothetical protein